LFLPHLELFDRLPQGSVSTAVGIQATGAEQRQASSSSVEAAREARFSIAP
jgi:hypothetical protein